MILRDANDNIILFGAEIKPNQIHAKAAWINKSAVRQLRLKSNSKAHPGWYTVDIGKKFSRKPTPSLVQYIYLPIIDS